MSELRKFHAIAHLRLSSFSSVTIEGPILDCWSCHHLTTQCFKGEYCGGNKDCGVAFWGVSDQGNEPLIDLLNKYLLNIFYAGHANVANES